MTNPNIKHSNKTFVSFLLLVTLLLIPTNNVSAVSASGGVGLVSCFAGEIVGALGSAASSLTSVPTDATVQNITTSGTQVNTKVDCIRNNVLEPMAHMMAKQMVKSMTQSTINWINTGDAGNPLFVTDPANYFSGVSDHQRGLFLNELNNVDTPLKQQVVRSILLGDSNSFERRSQYTLNDVTGGQSQTDDFLSGKTFSWDSWLSLTTNPANNPYGLYSISQNELNQRQVSARNNAQMEADWGNGLLSSKKCVQKDSAGKCTREEIITPGTAIESSMSQAIGSDLQTLGMASSFDLILDALIGKAFAWGQEGLRGQTRQVGGVAEDPSFLNNKNSLVAGVDKAVIIEQDYIASKTTSRDTLRNKNLVEQDINTLLALYQEQIILINKKTADTGFPPTGFSVATVNGQINQVTNIKNNTINGTWVTQLTTLETDVTGTQSLITELGSIKLAAEVATTPANLQTASNRYASISPALHSQTSIYLSSVERDGIQNIVNDIASRMVVARANIVTLGGSATSTPPVI